jgi:hypothetical protein
VTDGQDIESQEQWSLRPRADDARVVADFGVGSSGVGPGVGFAAGEFFPTPEGDAPRDSPRDAAGQDDGP